MVRREPQFVNNTANVTLKTKKQGFFGEYVTFF